jgi:hypothetical protein
VLQLQNSPDCCALYWVVVQHQSILTRDSLNGAVARKSPQRKL